MKALPVMAVAAAFAVLPLHAQESSEAPAAVPASPQAAAPSVIQVEDAASLESKVGTEVIVEGVVKKVGQGAGGGITFINFGEGKSAFVAVVFKASFDQFPEGFEKYANQKVRVRGTLEKFRDRQIQIKIITPDQLEIVASAP
ncbi:MAG: OB-fold nucleic acid binding domain-containing protein [Chthoniobacterales bacterium]|nr:OB-fold nucleic acid binding domain-containing protein [Chthoniobacterales bacterium]